MKRMLYVILAVAFGTNVASPLFPLYQRQFGLSTADVTVIFAVYALGVLATLLVSGSIAERIGPKPVALAALLVAMASALTFREAGSATALFVGRLLGGLAVGAFMATSNTLLVQLSSPERLGRAMRLSSTLNLFGFGLGPGVGGALLAYLPWRPTRSPYEILLLALAAGLVVLLTLKVPQSGGQSGGPFRIRLGVPAEGRLPFWTLAAPSMFAAFALGGIAFSLLPSEARLAFRGLPPGTGGILIFLMTLSGAIAQQAARPATLRGRLTLGMVSMGLGSWAVVSAEALSSPVLVVLAVLAQGAGVGLVFQASLTLAGQIALAGVKVRVMTTYFLCAYAGMIVPVLGAGVLSVTIGLLPSIEATVGVLTLVVLGVVLSARRASAVPVE